jgi:apolipoprotein N-acyltransferase
MPLAAEAYLRTAHRSVYDDFMVRRGTVRGEPSFEVYKVYDNVIAGNAACSSIGSPNDYRKLTQNGATFLANSASLEIFKGSSVYSVYHNGFARFNAVANARPFLQSANEWQAFALDHNGSVLRAVEPVGSAEVVATTNSKTTPYTVLGEWIALLGFVAIGAIIAQKIIHRKDTKRRSKKRKSPKEVILKK